MPAQPTEPTGPPFEQRILPGAEDADELGRVSNVAFVRWSEQLTRGHAAASGFDYAALRTLGVAFVVRRHAVRYLRGAAADRPVTATGRFTRWAPASVEYETVFSSGEPDGVAVRITTQWVCIDLARDRPAAIPGSFREALAQSSRDSGGAQTP